MALHDNFNSQYISVGIGFLWAAAALALLNALFLFSKSKVIPVIFAIILAIVAIVLLCNAGLALRQNRNNMEKTLPNKCYEILSDAKDTEVSSII